jgi:hypothetical protein
MQRSGMLNPGAQFKMKKGDTGKRLTAEERRKNQKLREKLKRQKKKKR